LPPGEREKIDAVINALLREIARKAAKSKK